MLPCSESLSINIENNSARVAHILMVGRLGHDKNYWIVFFFLAKYPFISKKYANYQIPLKSSFGAPFY